MAQSSPTIQGKVTYIGTSILVGGAAIGIKNTASNIGKKINLFLVMISPIS